MIIKRVGDRAGRGRCVGLAAVMIIGLSAGCGQPVVGSPPTEPETPVSPTSSVASPSATGTPDRDGLLVGRGTVLDDGSGPELCLGGVLQSLPPQCGGLALRGWTWPTAGVERERGTTWGDFAVVGRLTGDWFTVLKTVDPGSVPWPEADAEVDPTPCPEPTGGWQPVDPARATADDRERLLAAARRLPGYTDTWIDDLGDRSQDPQRIVVNVRVTGDVGEADRALRSIWGGSLCVSRAEHTAAELAEIQSELRLPGLLGSGVGRDRLEATVVFDDGALQRRVDRTYGSGLVTVSSALQAYAG